MGGESKMHLLMLAAAMEPDCLRLAEYSGARRSRVGELVQLAADSRRWLWKHSRGIYSNIGITEEHWPKPKRG